MSFFDFLMHWKILNDLENEELSEEDEFVDLAYINDQFDKERREKEKNKNKNMEDKWWK